MVKAFLLLLLPLASAATIATVNCNGSVVSNPTLAQCGSFNEFAAASASSPSYISASASAGSSSFASANASLSGTYLFTVIGGGGGGGFFLPCLGVATDQVGAAASASFGAYSISSSGPHPHNPSSICASMGLQSASSFQYGVGQEVEISMSASVPPVHLSFGDASAGLGDFSVAAVFPAFEFWDSNGTPLSDVSYSLTQVPEPGTFGVWLVVLLVSCIAVREQLNIG